MIEHVAAEKSKLPSQRKGFLSRLAARFALGPGFAYETDKTPTPDELITQVCEAVGFTRRVNKYPGAVIAGIHSTASPEGTKNGSIFLPISDEGKSRARDVLARILSDSGNGIDDVVGVGAYVVTGKKQLYAEDVSAIGIVLGDEELSELGRIEMDRAQLASLTGGERLQLGELLIAITQNVNFAYGARLHRLAH